MARTTPLKTSDLAEALRWVNEVVPATRRGSSVGDDDVPEGAEVVIFSRGQWRLVKALRASKSHVTVAYTTEGGIGELSRYGRCAITETRRKRVETYWPA